MASRITAATPSQADRTANAVQRDFRIFDYYRDTQRPKALIHGATAYYLQHPVPIRGMTLVTYEQTGETNLYAVADTCWIDRTNRVASSPDAVSFQLSGGRFTVKGTGFQWKQQGSVLTVSNDVHSVIRQDLIDHSMNSAKPSGAAIAPHPESLFLSPMKLQANLFASLLSLSVLAATPSPSSAATGNGFSGLLDAPKPAVTNTAAALPATASPAKSNGNPPTSSPTPASSTPSPTTPSSIATNNSKLTLRPRGDVSIDSAGGMEYQGETKQVTYFKNVKVNDPADNPITTIECDWLSTIIPDSREKMGIITGLTNVVITFRGEKELTVARGHRVDYNATNDTLVLIGMPASIDYSSGITMITEGPIIYERKTGTFRSTGPTKTVGRKGIVTPFDTGGSSKPGTK